jgi:hypothetical protein
LLGTDIVNSPFKSKGVAVGIRVGSGAGGVFVTRDANVVAIASSMGTLGVAVLFGMEHDVKANNEIIIKKYLMCSLYSFSEHFNVADVYKVKERE